MARKIFGISVLLLLLFFAAYQYIQKRQSTSIDKIVPARSEQIVAVFDTSSKQILKNTDPLIHETLVWKNNAESSLPAVALENLIKNKNDLFINLEIWPVDKIIKWDNDVSRLVLKGYYDEKLIALFGILHRASTHVYLRYNAEMEVPLYKTPWQSRSWTDYIYSFRHIYSLCKKYAPSVQMVWGPAGYPGTEEYWPGDQYADLISCTLDLRPAIPDDPYGLYPSLTEQIRRKFFRMRFMKKPVLFLGSESVSRNSIRQESLDTLNGKIKLDSAIYLTPIEPEISGIENSTGKTQEPLHLGVYDPQQLLTSEPLITTEHIFTNMDSVLNGKFKKELNGVMARHHDAIVTIESWKMKDNKVIKDPDLMNNILKGLYDSVWVRLFSDISGLPQTIYLRWGHEMEIPVDRYPWQKQDPVTYIKAFRYVVAFRQPWVKNIRIVWGPAGDRGSVEWWPGEDVVDYVSFAVYALPDKNINDYNQQISFSTLFHLKNFRMRFAHKPLFISEFGVKGPESYQKKWLLDAASVLNQNPEVKGVSYFNYADTPKAWGNAETPDWSITKETFRSFTDVLKNIQKKSNIAAK